MSTYKHFNRRLGRYQTDVAPWSRSCNHDVSDTRCVIELTVFMRVVLVVNLQRGTISYVSTPDIKEIEFIQA
jgi:hypothetical protein